MARYVKKYVTDYAYEVRETEDVENEKKKLHKIECSETVKKEKKKQPEQPQVSWDELANNTNLEQALNRNENRPS